MKLFLVSFFAAFALACDDTFEAELEACLLNITSTAGLGGLGGLFGSGCQIYQSSLDCTAKLSEEKNCFYDCDELTSSLDGTWFGLSTSNCTLTCESRKLCFPATSTVELESGKHINMDQLQVGDRVRVGPSEFSEVYFFSTEMIETTSKFVQLSTDTGALTLTKGHYLYVNGALKVASDAKVGDTLVLGNGSQVVVTEVSSVWAAGLYNPHTLHGDIVVDGIHTSTYTDAVHPTLAHALLSPLRTMYSAGISFGKDFRDTAKGMPSWLRKAIR